MPWILYIHPTQNQPGWDETEYILGFSPTIDQF